MSDRALSRPRMILVAMSFLSVAVCALSASAHYLRWAWGNPWQPISWLFSILFLLLAFLPEFNRPASLRSLISPKTAFFLFWIAFFVLSHLWNFRTAPWNGNGLFDESAWDLYFLKDKIIGHSFQPVWADHTGIGRETLFHYYVWGFLRLFGFNILSYEAALLGIWCATFVFTLLLIDLLFRSYIVDSVAALIFTFLPFAFVFTFAGFRYPMGMLLGVVSLYFLHLGFNKSSLFYFSLGGIAAGLCLASSIPGKQYVLALLIFAAGYAILHWQDAQRRAAATSVLFIGYGFVIGAMPMLVYIAFNYHSYVYYETSLARPFFEALFGYPAPHNLQWYLMRLGVVFFANPADRLFIPDALLIPLPYYFFLVPGIVLAGFKRRYEIILVATVPVVLALIAEATERRLLLPLPYWIILMAFTFARLRKLKLGTALKALVWSSSAIVVMWALIPSIQYIYRKTEDPFSIYQYAQDQVAVSRFLKNIVAGRVPANPPHLERNEFNRTDGTHDPPYETLICQNEAYSIIHLFLHDYNDAKILSLSGGLPAYVMTDSEVWHASKKALRNYTPNDKDLKLVWERGVKTDKIIHLLAPVRNLGIEESISFSFDGRERKFYVLNIASKDISEFQERIQTLPDSL